jgi:hypothetical protein
VEAGVKYLGRRRVRIVTLPAFALALLIAASSSACGGGEEAAVPPPRTVTVTVTQPTPAPPPQEGAHSPEGAYAEEEPPVSDAPATTTFAGTYFSIDYPFDWDVEPAEVSKGTYLDTTIRDPIDSEVMVRVDVSPESFTDPETVAAEVETYLADQPRYRRIRFQPATFNGYEGFQWDFVVEEDGILLRKSDVFFTTDAGDGVAVLIQAPAGSYRSRRSELEAARDSLVVTGEGSSSASDEVDAAEFCATHDCIDNFEEGRGYVVRCADGSWSQSGGIQGACSHHGGLAGSSSAPSFGDIDDNGDGSTYNWCGASRDGDGDGLWCEGR